MFFLWWYEKQKKRDGYIDVICRPAIEREGGKGFEGRLTRAAGPSLNGSGNRMHTPARDRPTGIARERERLGESEKEIGDTFTANTRK